eukprot:scaffold2804_cov181-Amphora_coffeaeformis.AAC.25
MDYERIRPMFGWQSRRCSCVRSSFSADCDWMKIVKADTLFLRFLRVKPERCICRKSWTKNYSSAPLSKVIRSYLKNGNCNFHTISGMDALLYHTAKIKIEVTPTRFKKLPYHSWLWQVSPLEAGANGNRVRSTPMSDISLVRKHRKFLLFSSSLLSELDRVFFVGLIFNLWLPPPKRDVCHKFDNDSNHLLG